MANWKKVIVSGSQAQLNQLSVDTSVNITGSLSAASTVKLTGLSNVPQATIVGVDIATGNYSTKELVRLQQIPLLMQFQHLML